MDWLKRAGLDGNARLGESLQVEAGWENAVETVLGSLLEGVLVDAPDATGSMRWRELGARPHRAGVAERRGGATCRADLAGGARCRARRRSVACWRACTPPKRSADARALLPRSATANR